MLSLVVRAYGLELFINRAILFAAYRDVHIYRDVTLEVSDEAVVFLEFT